MLFYILLLIVSMASVQSYDTGEYGKGYELTDSFENEYVGNPDDDCIIVRPCQVYDLNCIRHYFADHAKCKNVDGPIPDPLPRSQFTIFFATINLTVTQTNNLVYGLNTSRVEEFYVNKNTNKVVFTVNTRNLSPASEVAYFKFLRVGREPIVIKSTAVILYPSISFTVVIPNIDDMQLDKAEITTFLDTSTPPFAVSPEVLTNPDPTVRRSVAELVANVPTDVQETLLTEGPYFLTYSPIYVISDCWYCDQLTNH